MALLLDDEDVFVMTRPAPQSSSATGVVHVDLDGDDHDHVQSAVAEMSGAPETADATTTPIKGVNSRGDTAVNTPSTAAATSRRGEPSPASPGATVTLPRRGGDGLAKMETFMFGKPRVAVVQAGSGADGAGRKRSAQEAFGAVGASATMHIPLVQKMSTAQPASNGSSGTQPKLLSAARSSSSASTLPLLHDQASLTSLDTPYSTPREAASQTASLASPGQPRGSLSASPPARPPPPPSPSTPQPPQPAAEAAATQPAKTQMKLSDFFSKMACKR